MLGLATRSLPCFTELIDFLPRNLFYLNGVKVIPSQIFYLLTPVAQPTPPVENTPIDHLLFNELGTHLAVVDELGTITIWEQDNYAAHLIPRQSFIAREGGGGDDDTSDESANRIISLRWLHNDQKIHVSLKLIKNVDQWTCQGNQQRGYGPCNLVGKEAFVAVTCDARVLSDEYWG